MAPARFSQPQVAEALTPVRDVFSLLADELERARTLGLRVEGAICAIAVRSSIDGAVVAELQQLDAVLQHIAALRDFAAEAARQAQVDQSIATQSALARITLGDVRSRLSGGFIDANLSDDGWEIL
ncbi:MAG: hypothetical protein ABL883_01975 [Terricaulis sp.]